MLIRRHIPLVLEHRSIDHATASLSSTIGRFFSRKAADDMASQISRQIRSFKEREHSPVVGSIISAIEFVAWYTIMPDAEKALGMVGEESGRRALWSLGIPENGRIGFLAKRYALQLAKTRAAEMVGMRYDAYGNLVENPRARFAITENTRDMIKSTVEEAIRRDWGKEKLAEALRRTGAFSQSRADLIAKVELYGAMNKGEYAAWRISGDVTGTRWITKRDMAVERVCRDNEAAGVVSLGNNYPSGHRMPGAHLGCRCRLAAVVDSGR